MAQDQELKPRREARPLGKDELTEEQKEAGAQATQLLTAMATPTPLLSERESSKRHPYFPLIDKGRESRVVLLDGKRGSGKSALLITLLDLYQDALDEKPKPLPEGWALPPARCIVPAGLIDLEPLPESTNLLLHLLGHLERVVEALEGGEEEAKGRLPMAPWQGEDRSETASRRAWRELARTVTVGWDKGLDPRKGKLDPEAYVLEAESNELTRMGLPKALRKFLDALAKDYEKSQRLAQPPLFLLAIDDADMNPGRSAELLDLLRKLYHPRLAFLLAGDSELFEESLRLSLAKREGFDAENVHKMPRVLKLLPREIYNKVIPQHQRCKLKGLSPERRLDFPKEDPVRKKLERLVMPDGSKLLDFQPYPRFQGTGTDGLIATLLPETLRGLISFSEQLAAPPEGEPPTSSTALALSARAIATLWSFVVDSEAASGAEYLEFKDLVQVDGKGEDTSILVDSSKFVYGLERSYAKEVELERFSYSFMAPLGFALKRVASIQYADVQPESSDMPSHVSLAFALASEFARGFAERQNIKTPPLPMMSSSEDTFAKTLWLRTAAPPALEDTRTNINMHGVRDSVISIQNRERTPPSFVLQAHWPLPDWDSLGELVCFMERWHKEVSSLKVSTRRHDSANNSIPDAMAWGFLCAILQAFKIDTKDLEPFSWLQLGRALQKLWEQTSTRAKDEWLKRRLGLLAAPEFGLSADFADALLDRLQTAVGSAWTGVTAYLREERRISLRAALTKAPQQFNVETPMPSVTEIVEELDTLKAGNPFSHWVESEHSSPSINQINLATSLFRKKTPTESAIPELRFFPDRSESFGFFDYFTRGRFDTLKAAPYAVLQNLIPILRGRQPTYDPRILIELWERLIKSIEREDLLSWLPKEGTVPKTPDGLEMIQLFERKVEFLGKDEGNWHKQTVGRNFSVYISWSNQIKSGLDESMPVLAESVVRIVHDLAKDIADVGLFKGKGPLQNRETASPCWWHLVKVSWKGMPPFFSMPTVAWATLWEWEELEYCWHETYYQGAVSEFKEHPSWMMGSTVSWLLKGNHDCIRRTAPSSVLDQLGGNYGAFFNECVSLIKRYRKNLPDSYRPWAFEEWLHRLCVLGAPESALSEDTARSLLIAWNDSKLGQSETFNNIRPESYRVQRLLDSGYSEQQARQLLDEVDREFSRHPWYEFVKSYGS